jgi:hypothetical protein
MVPTKIPGNLCYCLIIVPLTLLLLWLLLPFLSTDTTTTTAAPVPIITTTPAPDTTTPVPDLPVKSCQIYGDPHGTSFDGEHLDFYTAGEFYLVKSTTVDIQARYAPTHATNGLSVTKQIAVSGPFLKGHRLIVGEEHAFWDGKPILGGFPSNFEVDGLVRIEYNGQGQLLQPGREGKGLHVLHITLPNQVSIQVNRWNEPGEGRYINVKITMPKQPAQDGDCGNFDGNAGNDARLTERARVGKNGVPVAELLLQGGKTAVDLGIENCPDSTLVRAHEECKAVTDKFWPSMSCLKTVCNGGTATATTA